MRVALGVLSAAEESRNASLGITVDDGIEEKILSTSHKYSRFGRKLEEVDALMLFGTCLQEIDFRVREFFANFHHICLGRFTHSA